MCRWGIGECKLDGYRIIPNYENQLFKNSILSVATSSRLSGVGGIGILYDAGE